MTTLTRYEPLLDPLDGLLNEFLRPAFVVEKRAGSATIRVDVKETAQAYEVHAEIPGVKKDDIAVEIEGNEVSLAAEVKREKQPKEGEKWLRTERFHGKAARRLVLPVEIDEARAEARFADGILELSLPKKLAAPGRKIAIQ